MKNYLTRGEVKEVVKTWIKQIRELVDAQDGLTIDVALILMLADRIEDELYETYGDKRAKLERVTAEEVEKKVRTTGLRHTAEQYDVSRVGLVKWCERNNVDWQALEQAAPYPK